MLSSSHACSQVPKPDNNSKRTHNCINIKIVREYILRGVVLGLGLQVDMFYRKYIDFFLMEIGTTPSLQKHSFHCQQYHQYHFPQWQQHNGLADP